MKKTRLLATSMILVSVVAVLCWGCAPSAVAPGTPVASQQTYNLKFAFPVAGGGDFEAFWQTWAKDIASGTNQRIKITLYFNATLGKAAEQLDMLKSGVADIAYHVPPWTPGAFPLAEASSLPYLTATPTSIFMFGNYLQQWDKCKEFNDYKMLQFGSSPSGRLFFTSKKVASVEDMKGLKVRAVGTIAKIPEALGASAVPVPTVDLYMALERKTVDGVAIDPGALEMIKGWEVIKYGISNPLYLGTHMIMMSKNTWNKLPIDLQLFLTEFCKGHQLRWLEYVINWEQSSLKKLEQGGVQMYFLSDTENTRWRQLLSPLIDEYIKTAGATGLPAKEAVDIAKKLTFYER